MSTVLVVNPGSSSLRAYLVDPDAERVLDSAQSEHGMDDEQAGGMLDELLSRHGEPGAVGYRLVHGGPDVQRPTIADDDVLRRVRHAASFAPQHVPKTLSLLDILRGKVSAGVPHVLCPDTAFHAGLPEHARAYPLPGSWRDRWGLRRYGFHGLSYAWALRRAAGLLGRAPTGLRLVLAHLGGGCSVCAVDNGHSVDTSMGMTPLEGVPMTTRSGSVDPGLLLWLLREAGLDAGELADGLERHSGLLGLSGGWTDDTRELVTAARRGDRTADAAMRVFTHRIRREIAAAASNLDRLDALVFTGEIGWDQPEVREDICAGLGVLGVHGGLYAEPAGDGPVSQAGAAIPVLVVRPREELQIAAETASLVGGTNDAARRTTHVLGKR